MKIAALGDAHLGRSYYPVTTGDGINQREHDFELSFTAAVDLALEQQPDLIVWLGDIFDHPRPSYRSYRVAQRALATVRQHGVRLALISGNHDTPRLPGTGSPYSALHDAYPEMLFAHRLEYARWELPGLVVHAVPQMLTVDATLEALSEAARRRSGDRSNLLITHPRVTQVEPRYADVNEIEVDAGVLQADFVLLGHYHFHTQVMPRIWYAGSTDTFSFADDPDKPKGIVLLDTDTGDCRHIALTGQRPLVTLPSIHALGLSPGQVREAVMTRAQQVPDGAVARLYIDDVDPEAYRLLDMAEVREASARALILKLEPRFSDVHSSVQVAERGTIPSRWTGYVAEQDLTGFDRQRIVSLGQDYLAAAAEASE